MPFPRLYCPLLPSGGWRVFLASAYKGLLVWKRYRRDCRMPELAKSRLCCDFAHQDEWRPEVGMRILLSQFAHGELEGPGHIARRDIVFVKLLHQLRSAPVVHIPKGEQQRTRASAE